jgi:hypothetical protein
LGDDHFFTGLLCRQLILHIVPLTFRDFTVLDLFQLESWFFKLDHQLTLFPAVDVTGEYLFFSWTFLGFVKVSGWKVRGLLEVDEVLHSAFFSQIALL